MTLASRRTHDVGPLSRRTLIKAGAVLAGAAALAPGVALAQSGSQQGTPPSVITNPPRQ